jgi:nucleotide-binding universal stress UspA family protein
LGDPAFEIVDYAGKNGVDLIMMPTHGYGKFRSMLLGSVAGKVLHDAECAVWTDTHSETPSAHREIGNVLCAIEVGTESSGLMETVGLFGVKVEIFRFGKAGNPGREVRDAALLFDSDLIVAGRKKVDISSIIHASPCPVLSV